MTFHALDIATEIVRQLREPVARLARFDRDLTDQVKRAASSIALCIGEARKRDGKDRMHLFRVAAGSAAEVQTALRVAEAWGYLEPLDSVHELLDRELAVLWRITHPR